MKITKTMVLVGLAGVITLGLLVNNVYMSSTGEFKCTNTEDAVLKEAAKTVMESRPIDQVKKDANLTKYCALHIKACGPKVSDKTPQVLEICQPYRQ